VYTTNRFGTIVGYINSKGNYTVVPKEFFEARTCPSSLGFNIKCVYNKNNCVQLVQSGCELKIGGTLKFSVETYGGLSEPIRSIKVIWEVSNGGKWENSIHQEIFEKSQKEGGGIFSFERQLAYKGTHLLKCTIINHNKHYRISKIFVVKGI